MATTVDPVGTRSLRGELETFIREVLAQEDTMNSERLVRMAHERFDDDEWIREALIREALSLLIPPLANRVRHQLRDRARFPRSETETRRERIASVFEHVGEGVSKSIFTMTRPDHLFVAREREIQAAGHLRWAGFHRAIADLHRNDTTETGALPPEKVANIWKTHIEVNL